MKLEEQVKEELEQIQIEAYSQGFEDGMKYIADLLKNSEGIDFEDKRQNS